MSWIHASKNRPGADNQHEREVKNTSHILRRGTNDFLQISESIWAVHTYEDQWGKG